MCIYIGLQTATNITDPILYGLFWIVYIIICLSLGNGIALSYFWGVIQNKTGPAGPRGPEGDLGDTGNKGMCKDTCRYKVCNIFVIREINNILTGLNNSIETTLKNKILLDKAAGICNSKNYEVVASVKGADNITSYINDIWSTWIQLIYDSTESSNKLNFFITPDADYMTFKWIQNENPFDELKKYDLWNWDEPQTFERGLVEICQDNTLTNELPQPPKPLIKYMFSNSYEWILDDYKSGASDDLSVWHPNKQIYENELYYPVGTIAIGPSRRGEIGTRKKYFTVFTLNQNGSMDKYTNNNIGGSGPDKGTILVAGDVVPPIDYVQKWDDLGARMYWDCSMWTPIPPDGYVALGDVIVRGYNKPRIGQLAIVRCVPIALTKELNSKVVTKIWSDRKSGADKDVTVFGIRNEPDSECSHNTAYNLIRCVPGHGSGLTKDSYPFRFIDDTTIYEIFNSSIIDLDNRDTNLALGWIGTPEREEKYSIYGFMGLIPDGIITAKSSGRKYYITHSKAFLRNNNKNTKIPMNSYIILYWNEKANNFKYALTATGSNNVKLFEKTYTDIRQQWEVVFDGNSNTEFRFKSLDTCKYLYIKPKTNLRGVEELRQLDVNFIDTDKNKIYTLFNNAKTAYGTSINKIKDVPYVKTAYGTYITKIKDVNATAPPTKPTSFEIPDITQYPDRLIKGTSGGISCTIL